MKRKLTPYNYTPMSDKCNRYIVIHYTGAAGTAENNAIYFSRNKLNASAHYFVDDDEIWQCVEDSNRAWHCGGGLQGSGGHTFYKKCTNSNSIGLELCCKKTPSGELYITKKTETNAVELTRQLMKKYNIPIDRVIRHYDVTGKLCPLPYVTNPTAWQNFKNMLTEKEEDTMTQEERIKFNELVNTVAELSEQVKELQNPMIYNYIDSNMPDWAISAVTWAVENHIIEGDNGLKLDDELLRVLVCLYRTVNNG